MFDFSADPFLNLDHWVQEAAGTGLKDPNAMALGTLGADQKPSVRIVLYKGLIRGGFLFIPTLKVEKGKSSRFIRTPACAFFGPR